MTTMTEFRAIFQAIQDDVMRDYPDEGTVCHMLHRDLGLGETTRDDAEETAERMSEETGETIAPDILDFTVEHAELHEFLDQVKLQAIAQQAPVAQLLSTMFLVGRRYGMKEAAEALGAEDGLFEDWGSDTAEPTEPDEH